MKKRLLIVALISIVFLPSSALAQEATPTTSPSDETTTTTEASPTPRGAKLQNRLDLKNTVMEKREAAKAQSQAQRAAFKQKLQSFKDARKKTLIERIDTKMATVNENRTDRMSEAIEKLKAVLAKITEKVDTAKQNGSDTTAADAAIAKAEASLTAAETAISGQAGKEYVLTLTDEASAKTTVGTMFRQLNADLQATHATVVSARQDVRDAAVEAVKLTGTPSVETPTSTITPGV